MNPALSSRILFFLFRQAVVHQFLDPRLVQMLADEDDLLHPVAVHRVPVAAEDGIALEALVQVFLLHRRVPEARVADALLAAGLLEEVALVRVVGEIAEALRADDVRGPLAGHRRAAYT